MDDGGEGKRKIGSTALLMALVVLVSIVAVGEAVLLGYLIGEQGRIIARLSVRLDQNTENLSTIAAKVGRSAGGASSIGKESYYIRDRCAGAEVKQDYALIHVKKDGAEEVISPNVLVAQTEEDRCFGSMFSGPWHGKYYFYAYGEGDSPPGNYWVYSTADKVFHSLKLRPPGYQQIEFAPDVPFVVSLGDPDEKGEVRSLLLQDLEKDESLAIGQLGPTQSYTSYRSLNELVGEDISWGSISWNASNEILAAVYSAKDPLEVCDAACTRRVPVAEKYFQPGSSAF
jgi:hypothetical protein